MKRWFAWMLALALVLSLTACGGAAQSGTESAESAETAETAETAEPAGTVAAAEQVTLRLGSSPFTVQVPNGYAVGGMTEEEMEDDMVGYYYSPSTLMDFDVYQFSKADEPEALADYAAKEAAEYSATPSFESINGIDVACYRAIEAYDEEMYNTLTYIFDTDTDYVEIVFWLDGATAEEEAAAIIHTLEK